uniref:Uncharacterized protein n=1 Tax=Nonomuraea gerenzanensis TaxID=93944 RepID=A0A1M4ECI6_9ACTN|nr:hypothetical protein BN4615_P6000 [Nonomuraea gerenzanensis]
MVRTRCRELGSIRPGLPEARSAGRPSCGRTTTSACPGAVAHPAWRYPVVSSPAREVKPVVDGHPGDVHLSCPNRLVSSVWSGARDGGRGGAGRPGAACGERTYHRNLR